MKNDLKITGWCLIRENKMISPGKITGGNENFLNFAPLAKYLYKEEGISYPKFYKMDNLSKLAFLAAERIFRETDVLKDLKPAETGVVLSNSSSSLDTDIAYQKTIADRNNYFPSPAVFVYTLPNIMIGEICIRHGIKGENALLVSEKFDAAEIVRYVSGLMSDEHTKAVLCGWVDVSGDTCDAALFLIEKGKADQGKAFTAENLSNLYQNN